MKNQFLLHFMDVIKVKVTGKNVDHFLLKVYRSKIVILDVKVVSRHELVFKIFQNDFDKINNIKTSSEVEIVEYLGRSKIKHLLLNNMYMLSAIILGFIILFILSNIIFSVKVIHSSKEIREIVTNELKLYGIERLHFKKSYKYIEQMEKQILKNYKEKIEWLEVEAVGTKYIVKVEERKIPLKEEEYIYQDIIADRNAIILKIEAENGAIMKKVNDYVKKGDILISGKIMQGDKIANIVKASGRIYGEVWYNIKVEFPIFHKEEQKTGKAKIIYSIEFLKNKLPLFDFKPFKYKEIKKRTVINNALSPFKLVKEVQYELKISDEIYTDSDAIIKAKELARKKMLEKLSTDETILDSMLLKYYQEEQKIYLDMFFKVYENIGKSVNIDITQYNQ